MNPTLVRRHRRHAVTALTALLATAALTASAVQAPEPSLTTSSPTGTMELPDEWMTAQRMSDGSTDLSAAKYAKARGEANQLAARTRSVYRPLGERDWTF